MAIFKLYSATTKLRTIEKKRAIATNTRAIECANLREILSFILTITISSSWSFAIWSEFYFFFVVAASAAAIWIRIGKPIIYALNFGRRWYCIYNNIFIIIHIGSKSLKVEMNKYTFDCRSIRMKCCSVYNM